MRRKSKRNQYRNEPGTTAALPGRPDDPKKPGGGYAEETPVTVPKIPLADNERATAEAKPPLVVDEHLQVRSLVLVRRRRRSGAE